MLDNVPEGETQPEIWMGEAGGAYNSGRPGVTDSFTSSFWFLDGFGVLSEAGESTFCRQTLVGGNYGLLQNTEEHKPNPDFFALQLWQTLMGSSVLEVTRGGGGDDRNFRAYAHSNGNNSVTYLLLNLSNETSYDVSPAVGDWARTADYVVTAESTDSQIVSLNSMELSVSSDGEFPDLEKMGTPPSSKNVQLDPLSYGFFVFVKP